MGALLAGVLPVFVLIAVGYGLRKSDFLPDATWRPIERLSINLLYPGFLIPAIWGADISGGGAGAAGLAAVSAVVIIASVTLLVKPLIRLDGPAFTSLFQGVIRWNSFVFLPVIQAVYGPDGLALAAVFTTLAVSTRFGNDLLSTLRRCSIRCRRSPCCRSPCCGSVSASRRWCSSSCIRCCGR
jgi:predicted permease